MLVKYSNRFVICFLIFLMSVLSTSIVLAGEGHDVLGVYKGGIAPAKVAAYEDWLGRPVDYVEEFQASDGWAQIEGPDWQLNPWKNSSYKDKLVLTVVMLPNDPETTLEKGAEGEYDHHFVKLAENLVKAGMPNTVLRIGHEFNGGWYRWTATGGREEIFAKYFQRIVTAMRSVSGQNFTFVWNPNVGEKVDLVKAYPGNDYVDVIGIDIYDQSWIPNSYPMPEGLTEEQKLEIWTRTWNDKLTMQYGLNWFADFAKEHNKPLCIPEWGVNIRKDGHGGGDNPYFIQWMHDWMEQNNVIWHIYFDYKAASLNDNHRLASPDTDFPNAAIKFLELWGSDDAIERHKKSVTEYKELVNSLMASVPGGLENLLYDKLDDAVVLMVNSSNAIVKNKAVKIDTNPDVKPIISDGRTLVPVRFISENMDGKVSFDEETSTVTIIIASKAIKFVLGSKEFTINSEAYELEVPAQTINDRTMIPLRAMAEAIGNKVFWDDRGLIVLTFKDNIFDETADKELIDDLINMVLEGKAPVKTEITDKPIDPNKLIGVVSYEKTPRGTKVRAVKATASDVPQPENNPSNTIDGSLDTRWSAEGEQWLQIELEEVAILNCIGMATYLGSQRQLNFEILLSVDGNEWTSVAKGKTSGTTDDVEYYYIDETEAKYVRINANCTDIGTWDSITEVEAYKK